MRETISRLLRLYSRVLNKHKYTTQIVTGGFLWFSGDLLCQSLVHLSEGYRKDSGFTVDWKRTFRMSLYGICFSAPSYAFWYPYLEKYSQRIFASQPPGTSLALPSWLRFSRLGMTAPLRVLLTSTDGAARLRTWKIIGFKLTMDTFVFDPLYLSLFFCATSLMEGKSCLEVIEKLRGDLVKTWLVDIAVWTPIQTTNFRYVPVLYQALVVQSCNIGWNAYLSFVQHKSQAH